jgi:hypothetical protein
MDPVSTAVIAGLATGFATKAFEGVEVIIKSYKALKKTLEKKFGADSDLVIAIEHLEKKPDAKARQAGVAEEVIAVKADEDPDVLKAAQELLDQLKAQPGGSTIINQLAGDNATQIGTVGGDVTIFR